MIENPPLALDLSLRYRRWAASQLTADWERLGHLLAAAECDLGIAALEVFARTYLPSAPWPHLLLALADAKARCFSQPLHPHLGALCASVVKKPL